MGLGNSLRIGLAAALAFAASEAQAGEPLKDVIPDKDLWSGLRVTNDQGCGTHNQGKKKDGIEVYTGRHGTIVVNDVDAYDPESKLLIVADHPGCGEPSIDPVLVKLVAKIRNKETAVLEEPTPTPVPEPIVEPEPVVDAVAEAAAETARLEAAEAARSAAAAEAARRKAEADRKAEAEAQRKANQEAAEAETARSEAAAEKAAKEAEAARLAAEQKAEKERKEAAEVARLAAEQKAEKERKEAAEAARLAAEQKAERERKAAEKTAKEADEAEKARLAQVAADRKAEDARLAKEAAEAEAQRKANQEAAEAETARSEAAAKLAAEKAAKETARLAAEQKAERERKEAEAAAKEVARKAAENKAADERKAAEEAAKEAEAKRLAKEAADAEAQRLTDKNEFEKAVEAEWKEIGEELSGMASAASVAIEFTPHDLSEFEKEYKFKLGDESHTLIVEIDPERSTGNDLKLNIYRNGQKLPETSTYDKVANGIVIFLSKTKVGGPSIDLEGVTDGGTKEVVDDGVAEAAVKPFKDQGCDMGERLRLGEKLKELGAISDWAGVERTLVEMRATNCELKFREYGIAAQSARYHGDTWNMYRRLNVARDLDPRPEIVDLIDGLEAHYGKVALSGDKECSLEPEEMPYPPDPSKSVRFAQDVLGRTCEFQGMVPNGEYTFVVGDNKEKFTVQWAAEVALKLKAKKTKREEKAEVVEVVEEKKITLEELAENWGEIEAFLDKHVEAANAKLEIWEISYGIIKGSDFEREYVLTNGTDVKPFKVVIDEELSDEGAVTLKVFRNDEKINLEGGVDSALENFVRLVHFPRKTIEWKGGEFTGPTNENEKPKGVGKFHLNGNVYIGKWENDFLIGKVNASFADGSKMVGNFEESHPHGKLVYTKDISKPEYAKEITCIKGTCTRQDDKTLIWNARMMTFAGYSNETTYERQFENPQLGVGETEDITPTGERFVPELESEVEEE